MWKMENGQRVEMNKEEELEWQKKVERDAEHKRMLELQKSEKKKRQQEICARLSITEEERQILCEEIYG